MYSNFACHWFAFENCFLDISFHQQTLPSLGYRVQHEHRHSDLNIAQRGTGMRNSDEYGLLALD